MLISHAHRFAFVHVPKTAGSSVFMALEPLADRVDDYWANRWLAAVGIHVNHLAPWHSRRFRPHAGAQVLERWLPADVFAGLFKFGFVRNPWDLLVSSYHFLKSKPEHRRSRVARNLRFPDYVEYEVRRGKLLQTPLLCDRDGRRLVDFVGRYESLTTDFAFVCRRIGIEAALPHVNPSRRGDYRDYYSPALADRVATAFASDIELFGYTFEPPAPVRGERGLVA